MSVVITIAVILVLVLLNAVYVAAEFAIVAAKRTAIEEQAAGGNARAAMVARILHSARLQDRYIATAQLGITLASLGLGMYGEQVLADWITEWLAGSSLPVALTSHAVAATIAIFFLTFLHIVLGEMVPKAIALADANRAALWLAPVMSATQIATYPLIVVFNGLGNALLGALRLPRQGEENAQLHTVEELQYIVRESEESGLLRPEAAEVIEELFEFGQLTAGEVMVPRVRVRGIELGCTVEELRDVVSNSAHTRYPVHSGDLDHIVGTIHIKDVLKRTREGKTFLQSDVHSVPFIPETSTLDKALSAMRELGTQMAIVMDEHGGTAGLLTIEDLFEEVIGDIDDMVTIRPPEIYRGADGHLRVAGTVRVDEVGEELDIELEHEEVDSVSGLVLALLDRPPELGDVVVYDGVQFTVLAVEGHGVAECKVEMLPPAVEAEGPEQA